MAYLKINNVDFSKYVNTLKINKKTIYNAQTNAHGNSVVDKINAKREIEVGIIPLTAKTMQELIAVIDAFNVSVSFLNPKTNALEENIACIIPENNVDYYTIQANKTSFKAFSIKIIEL